MQCPHCHQPLPYMTCPQCKGEVPEGSEYCCRCGSSIEREQEETDFSERTPCADGTCIGTIDEAGVCSICKKSFTRGSV